MKLAIKGHETRGAEVIEILKMLGGTNPHNYSADSDIFCFYIGKGINDINVIYYDWIHGCYDDEEWIVFTLEEFLEKFPYKVGDKVIDTKTDRVVEIYKAHWSETNNRTYYDVKCFDNTEYVRSHIFLQPYKEETMEEPKELLIGFTKDKDGNMVLNTHKDYEIKEVDGKFMLLKKKSQYPKTYKECCEVLMGKTDFQDFELVLTKLSINQAQSGINIFSPVPPHITLINNFYKLLICRDAYWRMAGDWKYDANKTEEYFYIVNKCGRIVKEHYMNFNHILAFPTEEMRDEFYKNFKELIEIVKELL